mgnify:CR=1 FL=1
MGAGLLVLLLDWAIYYSFLAGSLFAAVLLLLLLVELSLLLLLSVVFSVLLAVFSSELLLGVGQPPEGER